jgi:acetyl-CoA C-acetyltransferase
MHDVVIVSGVRTAIGKMGGTLKDFPVERLASTILQAAIKNVPMEAYDIGEIIMGHTKQSSDTPNIARLAALYADLPIEIPAYTVHRQCGSGMQSIISATQIIKLGDADVVVAGGVESMSTAPYYLRNARFGYRAGNGELLDSNTESQPNAQPVEKYGRLTMGLTAENIAEKYGITRLEQDEFAYRSQMKANAAITQGIFKEEIIPVEVKQGRTLASFDTDEHPRLPDMDKLGKLEPVFKHGGTVTAGNSSGRNDGAAAVVLMGKEKANTLGAKPLARIVSYANVGVQPDLMGIGPVKATEQALHKAGLTLADIDLIELNEAFAAQSLACIKALSIDEEKLNVNGGAIALGHPIGATGTRIVVSLLYELLRRKKRYGLATLCMAGGQGGAVIIENATL